MKHLHHIITFCFSFCCLYQGSAQIHENAIPFSVKENLPAISNFKNIPTIDSMDCKNNAGAPQLQFACPISTNLDPGNSGQWTETPEGSVWRLGIESSNAYSLYITAQYFLKPGIRMFVYRPGYEDLRGAFTSRNNNPANVLSIAPVRGDRLIIELNVPNHQHAWGRLKITRIYHDYLNIFKEPSKQNRRSTTDCDEDINCSNGEYWQTEKRAVCKIITNGGLGTGTLVGNTSGTSTPYLISAQHLITSSEVAAEALFVFNHETSGCQESLKKTRQSLSGATLVSTTDHQVDFALMELHEQPPPSYQPYYAGWDARNTIAQQGVCIHHPFGNAKQIAIEYHPIKNKDIGEGFDANSTWNVPHWELGTTEEGSSGAPLFDKQHRVIGTLSGGRSTCGYTRDDYFTKFGVAWDAYPAPSNQLKYWLDPAQTGQLVLDGYDPYGFNATYCDTAWNFAPNESMGLSNADLNWGWISGHNSAGYTQYAERYESRGALQINGVYLNVAKASSEDPLAHIELKVWEGEQYPEQEVYSELLFIKDLQPNEVNYIAIDSVLSISGPFFVGYKINYKTVSDTFALYHAKDRGYKQPSTMFVYNDGWYETKDPSAYGIATSLGLGISACYGKPHTPTTDHLNVYPNPCTNSITLDIPGGAPIYQVKCFDNHGHSVPVNLVQNEVDNILHFQLSPGVYHLKIITKEKSFASRFIVLE